MSFTADIYKGYDIAAKQTERRTWVGSIPALEHSTSELATAVAALRDCRAFIDYLAARREHSVSGLEPIGTTVGLVLLGVAQDLKAHADDHAVPRVPLSMAGTLVASTSLSSGTVYISNFVTGDEHRLMSVDKPRGAAVPKPPAPKA